jgi:hypothetical protein
MWSRIQDTELATQAYLMMVDNAIVGCEYHNNDHIEQMYQYLEDTNEQYDECQLRDWLEESARIVCFMNDEAEIIRQ